MQVVRRRHEPVLSSVGTARMLSKVRVCQSARERPRSSRSHPHSFHNKLLLLSSAVIGAMRLELCCNPPGGIAYHLSTAHAPLFLMPTHLAAPAVLLSLLTVLALAPRELCSNLQLLPTKLCQRRSFAWVVLRLTLRLRRQRWSTRWVAAFRIVCRVMVTETCLILCQYLYLILRAGGCCGAGR